MSEGLQVIATIAELRAALKPHRLTGRSIGIVPTMGNLHAGHLALVEAACSGSDVVVATLFVNPMQFGVGEDLAAYPRTFAADLAALAANGCHYLFAPSAQEMYPGGMQQHTVISVPEFSALHCGRSRPGHFNGVCTIVAKLFSIVQPDRAWFGLKDFQQFHILERMVRDLNLPVELTGIPTVREDSGLALSSRNGFLSTGEKQQATALFRSLQDTADAMRENATDPRGLEKQAMRQLELAGMEPDYFTICDRHTLMPANGTERELVILAAARIGSTRLIDNVQVDL